MILHPQHSMWGCTWHSSLAGCSLQLVLVTSLKCPGVQVDLRSAWADHFDEQQLTARKRQAAEVQAAQQLEEASSAAERARVARQAERRQLQVLPA